MVNKRRVGAEYEEVACNYLKELGYTIIEKNYRNRIGEIDIVAKDNDFYVFVEVKYRKNNNFGTPFEAVDYRKQNRIRNVARGYLYEKHISQYTMVRFDVVGITSENGTKIELLKNAF